MADFLTVLEHKGRLEGLKVAYVGDSNNVSNSLMFGAARFGVHIAIGSPEGYQPKAEVAGWTRTEGARTGSTLLITADPAEAVAGADVVYTDTWASMGQEAEAHARKLVFRPYQVNATLFDPGPVTSYQMDLAPGSVISATQVRYAYSCGYSAHGSIAIGSSKYSVDMTVRYVVSL